VVGFGAGLVVVAGGFGLAVVLFGAAVVAGATAAVVGGAGVVGVAGLGDGDGEGMVDGDWAAADGTVSGVPGSALHAAARPRTDTPTMTAATRRRGWYGWR
jgi:hypothetical protein